MSRSLRSLANNSRVFGYPEVKARENRKRGSYGERLTHVLAIVSERAKRASSVMFVFNRDFRYVRIYVYVIARVGVKFGINFTSVRLSGNKLHEAKPSAICHST